MLNATKQHKPHAVRDFSVTAHSSGQKWELKKFLSFHWRSRSRLFLSFYLIIKDKTTDLGEGKNMARLRAEPAPFDVVTDLVGGCQFPLWHHIGVCLHLLGSVYLSVCGLALQCQNKCLCVNQNLFSHRCCFFPLLSFVALHRPADFQTSTARRRNQRRGAASCSESKVTAWAGAGEEEAGWAGGTTPLLILARVKLRLWTQGPYNVKIHFSCFLAISFFIMSQRLKTEAVNIFSLTLVF